LTLFDFLLLCSFSPLAADLLAAENKDAPAGIPEGLPTEGTAELCSAGCSNPEMPLPAQRIPLKILWDFNFNSTLMAKS
jgi:hypothetical protein